MREIKFRVWDRGTKSMLYDYKHMYQLPYYFNILNFGDFIEQFDGQYDAMQYTGLKDKNGKEIYEGDILYNENDERRFHEILWSEHNSCWCLGDEDSYPLRRYGIDKFWNVVGNVYENPELLENNGNEK